MASFVPVNDAEKNFSRDSRQKLGNEEEDLEVRAVLVSPAESRSPELEKYLGERWETVQHRPNRPFRASFDICLSPSFGSLPQQV